MSRSEEGRARLDAVLQGLVERLGLIGDRIGAEQELLRRVTETQALIAERLAHPLNGAGGLDEATRTHIRNTDLNLGRLVEELGRGREEMTREIRGDIKLIARTLAIAAGEVPAGRD